MGVEVSESEWELQESSHFPLFSRGKKGASITLRSPRKTKKIGTKF